MWSKELGCRLIFILLLSGGSVTAGDNEWSSNGPFGGHIISLAVHPTNPDIIYAGCDDAGGIYKTTDGGENWNLVTSSVPDVSGWTIAIDPQAPNIIYAGDIYGLGIYKTTNGGANWEYINTGLDETHVTCLAINPDSTNIIYAGTGGWRFSGNGVYKSVDAGSSWTSIGLAGLKVYCLAINPDSTNIMYAGTHGDSLYKSTDAGDNWSTLPLPYPFVTSLAINPDSTNIVYAGTSIGIYKTTDGGSNWDSLGLGEQFVWSLTIDPTSTDVVYAATLWGGIYKSINGGESWDQINSGITYPLTFCVAVNPFAPDTLYTGTAGEGFYRSFDGGNNWHQKIVGMRNTYFFGLVPHPDSSDIIYAGRCYPAPGAFFYRSTDGGQNWNSLTPLAIANITSLAINPDDHDVFYAGATKCIIKTPDHGANWMLLYELPHEEEGVASISVDPFTTNTIYAGAYTIDPDTGITVLKSTNSGNDWTQVGFFPKTVESIALHPESDIRHGGALAIDPISSNIIYAGAFGGVYKSIDSGNIWSPVGLEDEAIFSLEINPDSTNVIYAGCESGKVFKSEDSASSWAQVDPGWSPAMITDILVNPSSPNIVYVARDASDWHTGVHGGISMSVDGGMNWTEIDSGMTTTHTIRLAIDTTTNSLYAGTYGGGVFCYTFSSGIEGEHLHNFLLTADLIQISPNPFTQETVIELAVNSLQFTGKNRQLEIYDLSGRLVKSFLISNCQSPIARVVWDGTDQIGKKVASGIYFCRLQVGDFKTAEKLILLR